VVAYFVGGANAFGCSGFCGAVEYCPKKVVSIFEIVKEYGCATKCCGLCKKNKNKRKK
jgi:hypothetical protein